jgi:hypothetical protein
MIVVVHWPAIYGEPPETPLFGERRVKAFCGHFRFQFG